jgi:multicomponent Na+:H+ antiporter subunit C
MMMHAPYWVAGYIFLIGLYGIVSSRSFIHVCICLAVIQSSTYVLLATIGFRKGAGAPVFAGVPDGTPAVDPVVQALMLTDVVVEATVMALLLAIVVQIHKKRKTLNPDELRTLRG